MGRTTIDYSLVQTSHLFLIFCVVQLRGGFAAVSCFDVSLRKMVGAKSCILAVSKPNKPITYLSEPRSIFFPVYFLDIFDGVEREVYFKFETFFAFVI